MVKKSLFEQELVTGMQRELRKQASTETPDLAKAAECLHAALEIFEEAGLRSQANALLKLMEKIAAERKTKAVERLIDIGELMRAGATSRDIRGMQSGDLPSRARVMLAAHGAGLWSDHELRKFFGSQYMSKEDAEQFLDPNRNFGKMWEWMQNPTQPVDPANPQPGETITMSPVPKSQFTPRPGDEIEFKSIAAKHRKPKRPDKIHEESRFYLRNLADHGTMLTDDDLSAALDAEIADALNAETADELAANYSEDDWSKWEEMAGQESHSVDDVDLFDFNVSEDVLEVDEQNLPEDFEEEIH